MTDAIPAALLIRPAPIAAVKLREPQTKLLHGGPQRPLLLGGTRLSPHPTPPGGALPDDVLPGEVPEDTRRGRPGMLPSWVKAAGQPGVHAVRTRLSLSPTVLQPRLQHKVTEGTLPHGS